MLTPSEFAPVGSDNRAAVRATSFMQQFAEESAHKRFSPRRNRWREIVEFDRRVRELEERQATINDELSALQERHRESERADREALATWVADGKGERPAPTAAAIRERIEQLVENRDALSLATTRVLNEKGEFVVRHRRRLARDAEKARRQAVDQYRRKVTELEQARDEALDARRAESGRCSSQARWRSRSPV